MPPLSRYLSHHSLMDDQLVKWILDKRTQHTQISSLTATPWLHWHPSYSTSIDSSQMVFHIPTMMWLEWHLLTVTLLSCPKGVTVNGEVCLMKMSSKMNLPLILYSTLFAYLDTCQQDQYLTDGWAVGPPFKTGDDTALCSLHSFMSLSHPFLNYLSDNVIGYWYMCQTNRMSSCQHVGSILDPKVH